MHARGRRTPLDDDQLDPVRGRRQARAAHAPRQELWVVAGRRAGGTVSPRCSPPSPPWATTARRLRPGGRATIVCLAVDRRTSPDRPQVHPRLLPRDRTAKADGRAGTPDGLELNNGVDVIVATNSFQAVRGRTIACAIFGRSRLLAVGGSANPDVESYQAIIPGMINVPGAQLVGISSPYRRSGLLFDRWRKHYGKDDDQTF